MACATSLPEEFSQYKSELVTLENRVVQISQTKTDPTLGVSLIELNQTLTALNQFNPETASSHSIHYMAERATSLIDRVRQQCDHISSV